MRKNGVLMFMIWTLLSGVLTATAAQKPSANPQKPVEENARTEQGAASQAEGQQGGAGVHPPAQSGDRAFGTIASVGVDRFEIKRMDGTAQTIMVDDQTRYGEGRRDAQKELRLEDLKPGDHVFVQGRINDNKELVALFVRRVTNEEIQRFSGERAFGEIIAIEGNQIKVRNPRQGEKTILINEHTVLMKEGQPIALKDLKAGDRIFALGKESDGQFVAARIITGQFRRDGQQPHAPQTRPEDH